MKQIRANQGPFLPQGERSPGGARLGAGVSPLYGVVWKHSK
ncbi:hypothetical protein [Maribellus comscasis]|nr:hypothetical protein [Maribellus comscasis]